MKKLVYSLLILVLIGQISIAEKYEAFKEYNKNYSTTKQSAFSIDNKYGEIIIANWDKNEISINLKITVKAKNQEKAEKILSQIDANFGQIGDSVYAKTIFDKHFSLNDKVEFEIKYIVKAPANIAYWIINKYGNIAINKITGKLDLDLKYGNLLAKNLQFTKAQPLNKIELAYSNANIHYCNYAKIDIKYGKLNIGNGKALDIKAKYTDVDIIKLETLYFEGKYGGFELDTIHIVKIDAKYMNVDIQYLSYKLETEVKYGNLNINNVSPFFSKIDVEAAFGNIELLIHPDAVYKLYADVDYGSLDLPKKVNIERIVTKKGEETVGIVGPKGKEITGEINIEMDYGNVKL